MSNKQFPVNANRHDPYKNFKFRVKIGNKIVAGVSKVSALKWTNEAVEHREGGDPSTVYKAPSNTKFEPITLERGVSHDEEFEKWAARTWKFDSGGLTSLLDYKRNITIESLNLQNTVVKRYFVYNCWVSEYQALPELDAAGNAVAIEMMVLQNEGWERDTDLVVPPEFSTEPTA